MSSDIGPVPTDGGQYLEFLIKVRTLVEGGGSIEVRKALLRSELQRASWGMFCLKLGGVEAVLDRLFPRFIDTIKGLPSATVAALLEANLTTPAKLAAMPDPTLIAIKGIGPAKLKRIRDACAGADDPESEFIEHLDA